jgi:hypothetical protein
MASLITWLALVNNCAFSKQLRFQYSTRDCSALGKLPMEHTDIDSRLPTDNFGRQGR